MASESHLRAHKKGLRRLSSASQAPLKAPEQAQGDDLGPAADVWGIGIILWEALTGEIAIENPDAPLPDSQRLPSWESGGDSDSDEYYPQLHEPIPSLGEVSELKSEVVEVVDGCLAQEPGERPSLREVAGALEQIAGLPAGDLRRG